MSNYTTHLLPLNISENSSTESVQFDAVHSNLRGIPTNCSYCIKQLAWELNMEMRHAVLPVTIFVGIEAVIGFVGNFLVLYVFFFRYPVSNFRYFVLSLAFIDFLSTLTTMPGEIVTQLYWYVYPVPMYCKVKSFFNVFTVTAEALFLFTIAVDRYRKVCTPFGKQIKPPTAKVICLLIYLTALFIALPVAILWGTSSHTKIYKDQVITITVCEKAQAFVDTVYPVTYVVTMQTVVVVCLLAIFVLYIFVAKKLIMCRTKRRHSTENVVSFSQTNGTVATSHIDQREHVVEDISVQEFPSSSESQTHNHVAKFNKAVQTCDTNKELRTHNRTEVTSTISNEERGALRAAPRRLHQNFITSPARQRMADTARVRRKTLIMFILTVIFIVTTILYLTLLAFIASSDDILQDMSDSGKATYFFFFRLVFINHVINPFIYGFLDTQFISGMHDLRRGLFSFYRVRVRPN